MSILIIVEIFKWLGDNLTRVLFKKRAHLPQILNERTKIENRKNFIDYYYHMRITKNSTQQSS